MFTHPPVIEKPLTLPERNQAPIITPEQTIIILTSDGGRGHIDAAFREKIKYKQNENREAAILSVTKEGWYTFEYTAQYGLHFIPISKQWLTYNYASEGVKAWDQAQTIGDLATQNKLIGQQPLANTLFGPNFNYKMRSLLHHHPQITLVVTTQPMGIASLHEAIAEFNNTKLQTDTPTKLKIVMTDLPTKHAVHFLSSFAQISEKNLRLANLIVDLPFPSVRESNPSLARYHQSFANLCPNFYCKDTHIPQEHITINFTLGPIDPIFEHIHQLYKECGTLTIIEKYKKTPIPLQFTPTAYLKLQNTLPDLTTYLTYVNTNELIQTTFKLPHPYYNSIIMTLMLGSKASLATLEIIDCEYALHKEIKPKSNQTTYLFVFSGDDKKDEKCLFNEVCDKAKKYYDDSEGQFVIIPLTNQTKMSISHLYCISDDSITRPGGMSILEQIPVSSKSKNFVVFAEISKDTLEDKARKDPKSTLIAWEKGNAEYLEILFGSQRVCILNKLIYMEGRREQLQNQAIIQKPYMIDPDIGKFIDDDTRKDCERIHEKNRAEGDRYSANNLIAGYAIYNFYHVKQVKQDVLPSNKLIFIYSNAYDHACRLVENQQTFITQPPNVLAQSMRHPCTWAVYFANFIHKEISESIYFDEKSYEQIMKELSPMAKAFANAFYDASITIISDTEAIFYAGNFVAQGHEYAINAVLRKRNELDALIEGTKEIDGFIDVSPENIHQFPDDYHRLWALGHTIQEKINSLFNNYLNPPHIFYFFNPHPYRGEQRRAEDIIRKMQENANSSLPDILKYLTEYKNTCLKETQPNGSFMTRLNYVIKKVEAENNSLVQTSKQTLRIIT